MPTAVGGVPLSCWEKGGPPPQWPSAPEQLIGYEGVRLYDNMLERVQAAQAAAAAKVPDQAPRLRALLFYQGESDCDTEERASTWGKRFAAFVRQVRADLQAPTLPVVLVAVTTTDLPICTFRDEVRRQQLGLVAASGLEHVAVVDAHGLELQADGLHLTIPAQVTLGQRLAQALLQLEQGA